jgi:nucleotide sugar dehydrogenase
MRVTVVGAGKMGLPLACQFARRGAQVTACDANPAVVEAIRAGACTIDEPGVDALVRELVAAGRLEASADTAASTASSDVIVVIVPALLTRGRDADLSMLEAASIEIARGLRRGSLVSYETTIPVGGTRRHLRPVLERSGLQAGVDFDLAFSPERVKSQHVLEQLEVNPKVVGGLTPAAAERASAFYRRYLGAPVLNVGTLEAAEMVKLAGMAYRDVNIALANELARYAEAVGVDFPALIGAINTDGEAAVLQPGIGVGGHCTPVYPYFLIRDAQRAGAPATLSERARRVNDSQARHVLDLVERTWKPLAKRRVMILGLAFRPGVREHTLSPAFTVRDELQRRGAIVSLHDPLYTDEEIRGHGFEPGSLTDPTLPDALVLVTAHQAYHGMNFAYLGGRGVELVVDGRNLFDPAAVRAAGLHYVGVGRTTPAERRSQQRVPMARPVLLDEEAEAAASVVRSGWILQGPKVAAFERDFARFTGAPHACAVSSGTAALHLALLGVGVGPGDEVITVSHSYIATANSIRYCGAAPVFVDIDPASFNMDPARLAAALSPRTRAILCVHQAGLPCDLRAILAFAREHGLRVVEDAACAAGSEILWDGRWERIGRPHGDAACFSFHPRKLLTTGDGGMITTSDAQMDRMFRLWRQHGMDAAASAGPGEARISPESFPVVGYNYRMTDVQAAIGRAQLKRLPELVARRRELVERYRRKLGAIPSIAFPSEPAWARTNWQTLLIGLPPGVVQREVIKALHRDAISSRPGIMNAHEEPAYAGHPAPPLPHSERARRHCLALPLYDGLTAHDIDRLVAVLAEAARAAGLDAAVAEGVARESAV